MWAGQTKCFQFVYFSVDLKGFCTVYDFNWRFIVLLTIMFVICIWFVHLLSKPKGFCSCHDELTSALCFFVSFFLCSCWLFELFSFIFGAGPKCLFLVTSLPSISYATLRCSMFWKIPTYMYSECWHPFSFRAFGIFLTAFVTDYLCRKPRKS